MTGVERLKSMIEEGPLKKPLFKIYMYLKNRTDMDEKYLNPEKSLTQMYEYIKEQVRKQAVNGVAMIEDAVVYGLAIHYFDESNEDLGLNKKVVEKVIKKTESISNAVQNIVSTQKKEEREQLSLF
ncbi:MAG: hypothetical protein J6J60_08760 [Clostridia bacterium]|nr:hypothetical protein [Clostridia bacterium]MBP3597463.1 hypothetical protein [Clostridia bacterium]